MKISKILLFALIGYPLTVNAYPINNLNKSLSLNTFVLDNPEHDGFFVNDFEEMVGRLTQLGFKFIGTTYGDWSTLNDMSGAECLEIREYKKEVYQYFFI